MIGALTGNVTCSNSGLLRPHRFTLILLTIVVLISRCRVFFVLVTKKFFFVFSYHGYYSPHLVAFHPSLLVHDMEGEARRRLPEHGNQPDETKKSSVVLPLEPRHHAYALARGIDFVTYFVFEASPFTHACPRPNELQHARRQEQQYQRYTTRPAIILWKFSRSGENSVYLSFIPFSIDSAGGPMMEILIICMMIKLRPKAFNFVIVAW